MNILLVNDDGIEGKGLWALVTALHKEYNLTVVAPIEERSGFSHAMTYKSEIHVREYKLPIAPDVPAFAISGAPADCTKMGVHFLCKQKPDLVVSGINRGANLGTDIQYSGTFAAALEAGMLGVHGIAVSQLLRGQREDFVFAAEYTAGFVRSYLEDPLPLETILNINFPVIRPPKGIRLTRQSRLDYQERYEWLRREGKDDVYRLRGDLIEDSTDDEDLGAVLAGYISLTPFHFDRTDQNAYALLQQKRWTNLHD